MAPRETGRVAVGEVGESVHVSAKQKSLKVKDRLSRGVNRIESGDDSTDDEEDTDDVDDSRLRGVRGRPMPSGP